MISIITSLNMYVQKQFKKTNPKKTAIKSILAFLVLVMGMSVSNAQNVPVFSTCPPGAPVTLTLPAGASGTITFTDANIPTLFGVAAVDPDGVSAITYSASPGSVNCSNIGMVAVTVTATDVDGSTNCGPFNITVVDGGPQALCQDITVFLDAAGSATVTAAAVDNGSNACGPVVLTTAPVSPIMYNCTNVGPNVVTLTATSGGMMASCMSTVTVADNINPSFTCPSDVTINLNGSCQIAVPDLAGSVADENDNCSPPLAVTMSQMPTAASMMTLADGGTTMVTVTATDANSNTASCMVTLTADDVTPPTAVCQNLTVSLDGMGNGSITGAALNNGSTDNCSAALSFAASQTAFNCSNLGANAVTLTVTDGGGNMATAMCTVTVADNMAPMSYEQAMVAGFGGPFTLAQLEASDSNLAGFEPFISGNSSDSYEVNAITNTLNECEGTLSWPMQVTDNCGSSTATITGIQNPKGLPVDPNLVVTNDGTNYFADFSVGTSVVEYNVMDANGNSASYRFMVIVSDVDAPTINSIADQTLDFAQCEVDNGTAVMPDYRGLFLLADNCPNYTVEQVPAPGGPIPGPVITGTTFSVTVTITDVLPGIGNTGASSTFNVTLNQDDDLQLTNPIAVLNPITQECGAESFSAPTATDACGNLYSGVPFPVSGSTNLGPPAGMPMTSTGTGSAPDADLTGTQTSTITIGGVPSGHVITDVNVTINLDHSWIGDIDMSLGYNGTSVVLFDQPGINNSFFGCSGDDMNVVFDDAAILTAQNLTDDCNFSLPEIQGTFQSVDPLSAFNDLAANGDWTLTINDNFGDGFVQGTGTSWTLEVITEPASADQYLFPNGTHNITWNFDDGNGNTTSQQQVITVSDDSEAPTFDPCQDVTLFTDINGDATLAVADVTSNFADNCTGVDVIFTGSNAMTPTLLNFDCSDLGSNSVTLNAFDQSPALNQSSCTVNVTVQDNTDPVLLNIPSNAFGVDCNNIPDAPFIDLTFMINHPDTITASDACGMDDITFNEASTQSVDPASCNFYNYTITRTWTALDDNGNQDVETQTITVLDVTAPAAPGMLGVPLFTASNSGSSLSNGGTVSVDAASCEATVALNLANLDDCADMANLDIAYNVFNGGVFVSSGSNANASGTYGLGMNVVNFVATDPCGNVSSTFTFSFTVEDNVAPVASCVNQLNLGLPASGLLTLNATAVDNNSFDDCTAVSVSVTPNSFDCDDVDVMGGHTVTLTAMDAAGNTSNCTTTVNIQENNDPTALGNNITISLDGNNMANITPADVDNGSFDDCTAVTLMVNPSSFTEADLGPNIVTLTVTDENGNTSSTNVTVTVTLPPTCFNLPFNPPVSGGAGDVVQIPVTAENFTSLVGFQFEVGLSVADVGEFVGVSNIHPDLSSLLLNQPIVTDSFISVIDTMFVPDQMGMDSIASIDTTYTDLFDNIAVTWSQNNSSGMPPQLTPVTIGETETLFTIDLMLTGNIGETSFINLNPMSSTTPPQVIYSFNNTFYPQGLACVDVGLVRIGEIVFSGLITNEDLVPVALVDVDLERTAPVPNPPGTPVLDDTDQTGVDGLFALTANLSGNYTIIPTKDINWSNGIDVLDVGLIQRHTVGNPYVGSAYKKIAADVSGDGDITTFDAVLLNAYIASFFNASSEPSTPSWQFADAKQALANDANAFVPPFRDTIEFMNIFSDSMSNNFIAVKTGDIGGLSTADVTMFVGQDEEGEPEIARDRSALTFVLEDRSISEGQNISLDFTAENFEQMMAYQWILKYDAEALRFVGSANTNLSNLTFSEALINEGQIIMTWFDAEDITKADEEVLFSLNFEVLNDKSGIERLFEVVTYDNFNAVAYRGDETPMPIGLNFTEAKVEKADFVLNQNTPNPFKDETVISFVLPESADGTLTIMDVTGRVLRSFEGNFSQGYNEVSINRADLPQAGTVFYELKTAEYTASKKMIIID